MKTFKIDLVQGIDDSGDRFGFVYNQEGQGGFFFTWRPTLAETVATLEPCIVTGDGGLDEDEVRVFLRGHLLDHFQN